MNGNRFLHRTLLISTVIITLIMVVIPRQVGSAQSAEPPSQPVKLIFIHHSTGENWLTDEYGDLGKTLAENNYFVSDTNYGWGPNGIGDRTDIPDWVEWFSSEQTSTYMQALFNESGQNSGYTRTFADPGGENTIVMFKSCFPNSALEGSPIDAPNPEVMLSVGHAKYVYNEILKYFQTRPDKLFIVITAPPLSDGTYAANARAFNQWLVNDWLVENNYPLKNVAVFDFYNILTSPDAHHRIVDGQVEHTVTDKNTLAYPSGDDHPSVEGSRKATEEFIPMLNYFYRTWVADSGAGQPAAQPQATEQSTPTVELSSAPVGVIDNFDSGTPIGTGGWQAYLDETEKTQLTCAATSELSHSDGQSLKMEYDVVSGGWATCDLSFDHPQDWTTHSGIGFYLHADQPLRIFSVNLFSGSPDAHETYTHAMITGEPAANGWQYIAIPWQEFTRVEWEENAGSVFNTPEVIFSIAFGFSADLSAQNGIVWIDQLGFSEMMTLSQANTPTSPTDLPIQAEQPSPQPEQTEEQPPNRSLPVCGAGFILPIAMLLVTVLTKRLLS